MRKLLVISVFLMFSNLEASQPDSRFTYPSFCSYNSPEIREIRYEQRIAICHRSVSSGLKRRIYRLYKIPRNRRSQYTIDHLIPLSLGGSNNIENLWPQHRDDSTSRLEFEIYRKVNNGQILIQEAWNAILEEKYKK